MDIFQHRFVPESFVIPDGDVVQSVPATIAEEPWALHNYANVQIAQANVHGPSTKTSASGRVKT